jgi:hypothetical protein
MHRRWGLQYRMTFTDTLVYEECSLHITLKSKYIMRQLYEHTWLYTCSSTIRLIHIYKLYTDHARRTLSPPPAKLFTNIQGVPVGVCHTAGERSLG